MVSTLKKVRLALLLGVITALLVCGAAAGYTTVAQVNAALTNNSEAIKLTQDIKDTTALVVPAGKTLNLNGYTIQTVGITVNGTVTKNGGKLVWLVSEPIKHEAGTPTNNPKHILYAYNAVLSNGNATQVDYIRLQNDVWFTYTFTKFTTIFPNPTYSSGYVKLFAPETARFDLAGKNLYLSSVTHTNEKMTADTVGGGRLRMYSWDTGNNDSELSRWTSSVKFLRENSDVPGCIYLRADLNGFSCEANYDFVVPQNCTLYLGNSALTTDPGFKTTITFESGADIEGTKDISVTDGVIVECANLADFQRTALLAKATLIRLTEDITLSKDIDLGSCDLDYNGYIVSGGVLKTTGTVTYNGGGKNQTVTTEAALRSAAADNTVGKITLGANISLSSDVDLGARRFDFDAYDLTGGTVVTTGIVSATQNGGNMRTVYTPEEFWATLNEMRTAGSKITVMRLGCELDVRGKMKYADYPKVNYNGAGSGTAYMWLEIPTGCKLDVVGNALIFRPSSSNIGTVVDSCANKETGRWEGQLYQYAWITGTYTTPLDNACKISQQYEKSGRVTIDLYSLSGDTYKTKDYTVGKNAYLTGKALACKTLTLESGVTTNLIQTAQNVIYECENVSDFTRFGTAHADVFRLVSDIRDDDLVITLGGEQPQELDLNGHNLFCKDIVLKDGGSINENGGHLRLTKSAATMAELQAALTPYTDVTLTADISDADAAITASGFASLDLNGHSLTCKRFSVKDVDVFDSSDGKGKLTAQTCTIVDSDASAVALRDGSGYRFFKLARNVRRQAEILENGSLRLAFCYNFSNSDANTLIQSGSSGLRCYVNLYNDDTVADSFYFSSALTVRYAELQQAAPSTDYVLYITLNNPSKYGGEVYTDAFLMNENLAQEAHTTEAGGKQKLYLPTTEENSLLDKTIGEIRKENEDLIREAIVRTAFAYYDRNPYTQYGMGNEGYYIKNIYTGYNNPTATYRGTVYDTTLTNGSDTFYFTSNDSAQYPAVFATRESYGVRRTLEIDPEQIWDDNRFFSQCSSFPHYVYSNAFRTAAGSETFTGDNSTKAFHIAHRPDSLTGVTVDGEAVTGYTYDSVEGTLTLAEAPAVDTEIIASFGSGKYQVYGGPGTLGGYWYGGSNSDMANDPNFNTTVCAWYNPDDSQSSSFAYSFPLADFKTELKKMRNAQAGDILNTAAHVMLCIGDYDHDGDIEYMHSWPVLGDTENNGNYVARDIYKSTNLNTPYREAGERHETNGALEIIYWKETKWDANGDPIEGMLLIDEPLSGKVHQEQRRITVNETAQYYFIMCRPLMSTVETTHTGLCACMDNCTLSEAAKTRMHANRLSVEKWLADESGETMIYASQTVLPGQTVTVRLQLKNNGSEGFNLPAVTETLPNGVTLVSGSLEHTNVAVNAGETVDLSYKVKIGESFQGGDTITFPAGTVLGLHSRAITIRISDEIADAAAITAAFADGIPTSLADCADYDLDFIKLFYQEILGKEISLPYTFSSYLSLRMDTIDAVGQFSKVTNEVCSIYRPKIDAIADDERTLTTAQKTSLALAKIEVPKTLNGRYVAINSDRFIYDSEKKAWNCTRYDGLGRYQELGWENYYLPGDAMICMRLKNPFILDQTKLDVKNTDVAEEEIYIYLGNGKALKHTAAGTTIETFAKTFGNSNTEGYVVVLRPLTVSK